MTYEEIEELWDRLYEIEENIDDTVRNNKYYLLKVIRNQRELIEDGRKKVFDLQHRLNIVSNRVDNLENK